MKLVNRALIFLGCLMFGLHFAILIVCLFVYYLLKSIYYKATNKGDFNINPFAHTNPGVMQPTSKYSPIQCLF